MIMIRFSTWLWVCFASFPLNLTAGTVVITSLPDAAHPLAPLTAVNGVALAAGSEVRVGAFPGMTDDEVLNAAASGGLAQVVLSFAGFGTPQAIGDGVGGAAGSFEISLRQAMPAGSPLVGEEVSLIVQNAGGQEFFVARFKGIRFAADPDTGLEQLLPLHLADAKILTGTRYGRTRLATSSAPASGSFGTWIDGFSSITDPLLKRTDADADGDGRSNFLEYVTGTSPVSAAEDQPCQLVKDGADFWVRFSRAAGLGSAQPVVEMSGDFISEWEKLEGAVEPDPSPPGVGGLEWLRIRVPAGPGGQPLPKQFFRLRSGL
jgi:hypothetical protein